MQHKDFSIGIEFECGGRRWRCTDVGTRTVIAISLDHLDDPSWYSGPPYAIFEIVFDENDMPACTLRTASGQMPACHSRLRNKTMSSPASSQVHGQWFNIRFTPDLGTGERLNIGVGLIDVHGGIQTRMLSNFERLRRLYDGRVDLDGLHFLIETLDSYWRNKGHPSTSPIANISFSDLKYASGSSVAEILDDLYTETVLLDPFVAAKRGDQ